MPSFTPFLLPPGLILHYTCLIKFIILNTVCSKHTWYDGFCETVIKIIQQPRDLSQLELISS